MERKFGKNGKLIMLNDVPENSFNLLLGQIVLTLWEMVDVFNMLAIPYDADFPCTSKWCLSDFVPKKVSPSGTSHGVSLTIARSDCSICFATLYANVKLYHRTYDCRRRFIYCRGCWYHGSLPFNVIGSEAIQV